tara:strand:+ start:2129 stop:2686 length:558 start_codon:yes stop_codon:yes gene_type:complete
MINEIFNDIKVKMNKTIDHFSSEISVIRTGRASSNVLDIVKVDYYGSLTPLKNIANISTPDPQSIVIQPFDPTSIEVIEKAIIASDLGMNPANDGTIIRLVVPTLTEERRNELTKVIHKIIEDGRIAIRNIRRDANEKIKDLEKTENLSEDNLRRALDNIQEITDENIKKLNLMQETKEKELHSQ